MILYPTISLQTTHGSPTSSMRHVGDLGNIMADAGGNVSKQIMDKMAILTGDTNVLLKAIVVHEGQDDLGLGGDDGSTATGNAGARLGCCVIQPVYS